MSWQKTRWTVWSTSRLTTHWYALSKSRLKIRCSAFRMSWLKTCCTAWSMNRLKHAAFHGVWADSKHAALCEVWPGRTHALHHSVFCCTEYEQTKTYTVRADSKSRLKHVAQHGVWIGQTKTCCNAWRMSRLKTYTVKADSKSRLKYAARHGVWADWNHVALQIFSYLSATNPLQPCGSWTTSLTP